ncbi:hypothetical protein PUN28_009680 [Cardiocondyla obscurior]|uniref:Uncharacterized protein n=1 Tax=Cardiocondyla obscurior TaxID=286306 RepID=A0AAW2FVX0_9HYME
MAISRIIILSALVVQALSAPSGCIESCSFLETSIHQASRGYQDHENLVQARTNLNDYDYAKPGNWTEHNQYSTDSGHGKVHEERGQYVEGSKKVRYYKKNFTSAYGNVNGMNAGEAEQLSSQQRYGSIHLPSSQHIDSQSAHGLEQTMTRESGYNRVHSQQAQSLSTRINSQNERLEDFGADSYRTNGGHGQVFEEEGQYVTGPKKVRYYQKNYTSSYSSNAPQSNVAGSTTLDELHSKLHRNLQQNLDSLRKNLQISTTGHTSHVGSTVGLTQEAVGFHDLQTAESDNYRQNVGYRAVPSTGNTHHYIEQQRETLTDTRHLPYTYPTAAVNSYGAESHQSYQSHESHVSQVHPVSQLNHLPSSYVQVPRSGYQTRYHDAHSSGRHLDETSRAEVSGTHQSSVLENQLIENSQRVYPHSSHIVSYPSRQGESRHYEEHWAASSQTGGSVPEQTITDHSRHGAGHVERAHYDRDAYNEYRGRDHTAQGYESRAHASGSNYDSAYRTNAGQLVTGSLDLGHAAHGVDCTQETHQQYQQETRYHRKYKRDADYGDVQHQEINNDFTQQNQESGQESQNLEDLTQSEFAQQNSDDFTQQASDKLGQQTIDNQHLDDFIQQNEQLTQQTEGQLELGQQVINNQHLEDLTQQTEGQLEFGQQTIDNLHSEDSKQQNEQFSQQTEGQLEFGEHLENSAQKSEQFTQHEGEADDLMQQSVGKLEFGQREQATDNIFKPKNQRLNEFDEQSEDFTQQTGRLNDFSQQAGYLEYGQQREQKPSWPEYNTQRLDNYYPQNTWNIDNLPQQSHQYPSYDKNNERPEWQLEQMPQKKNFDQDFTQQTDQEQLATVRPAPKPKLRPRYQKHNSDPRFADETDVTIDNVFKPVEVKPEADIGDMYGRIESSSRVTYPRSNHNTPELYSTERSSVFDNQKENMDRLHWVHKSNDATVGLQWHYAYHPSDLANVESSHDDYYSRHNADSMSQQTEDVQQQSKPFYFDQQETQGTVVLDNRRPTSRYSQSRPFQQTKTSRPDNQFNQNSGEIATGVIPLQRNENTELTSELEKRSMSTTEQADDKLESRILQAYGGGPYDAPHSDDFYNRVRLNPSATLPPITGDDPWDIREKPREVVLDRWPTVPTISIATELETTTEIAATTTEPSFWRRVGHKISNTYDKAKEKAKEIFG